MKIRILTITLVIPIIAICDTISICDTCEVNSIKSAISLAEDGDQILIHGGLYTESSIYINKQLHIKGIDFPVIDQLTNFEL